MDNVIKQLVSQSYTNGKLDEGKTERIAQSLTRSHLKEYIRILKETESKNFVFVYSGMDLSEDQKNSITKMFSNRNLVFRIDRNLISGIKIIDYDTVYELNIAQIFTEIKDYLIEYD